MLIVLWYGGRLVIDGERRGEEGGGKEGGMET